MNENKNREILDAGYWMPDTGSDAGYWMRYI